MNKFFLHTLAAGAALCFSGFAVADTYAEVWTCKLEEGKTVEDAHAVNRQWLKWVNENVDGGEITGSIATSVVGDSDAFAWVDTYPDLATWSATKAALDTEEGKAMDALFEGITDCDKNRLWKLDPTE